MLFYVMGALSEISWRPHTWFRLLSLTLLVCASSFAQPAQFDGPAELPRVYVHSALADTPAPGKVISVHAGDNLQPAINKAGCGDQIELQSRQGFTGAFPLP